MPRSISFCQEIRRDAQVWEVLLTKNYPRQVEYEDPPSTASAPNVTIMTLADLRPLITRPLEQYAAFSGRSGRAEFWLFILTIVILTNLAWIAGFGAMKLAGYDSHHHGTTYHDHFSRDGDETERDDLSDGFHDGHDSPFTFKLHRHKGDENYHLHGSFDPPQNHHWITENGKGDDKGDGDGDHHVRFHVSHDSGTYAEDGAEAFQGIVTLALLIPFLAVGARRLHDTGKSGWWQLFVLIPLAGWLVLFIYFLMPGDEKKNRFGAPPG